MFQIPQQVRLALMTIVVVALLGAVVTAGFLLGQAQQMVACSAQKEKLQGKIDELAKAVILIEQERSALKLQVEHSNHAVDLLKAQSDAADKARIEAERQVAEIKKTSDSRIQKLSSVKEASSGCADLLGTYWEMRN